MLCIIENQLISGSFRLFYESVVDTELQIRGGIEDNSKIIFLIFQPECML